MLSAATSSRRALLFARALPASARASSAAATAPAPTPAAAAPSPAPAARAPLTPTFKTRYIVERTATGQLPVYSDVRNGGTNHVTVVRRIKGSAELLRDDLARFLADGHIDPVTRPPGVSLRHTSRAVEVKGRWVAEVKGWLEMRGF
ncbi:hypothetical protein Q8F55_001834 [Vanrija albida]|uniref:Large ribosomal subunit protein mL49 n=1 Tax=Vanrija albida TaxID=181172 RepID=A0ABR3Q830_9TREE